jgi:hypothetical protein
MDKLLNYAGLTREELVTFGDGMNDLPMIEIAGLGVCMANGRDELKEAADYVTLSNDEDGIAHALYEKVL